MNIYSIPLIPLTTTNRLLEIGVLAGISTMRVGYELLLFFEDYKALSLWYSFVSWTPQE